MTLPTDSQNTSPNNADDPFGGMDMMAWMESLAKRQGANSDELTTAANIDVPLPPPDAVVTGPGYTPGYELPKSKASAVTPPSVEPARVTAPPSAPPASIPAVQSAPTPPSATADPNDPFGGMDMMAWMESLAKRQGASSDELMTAANIDIPLPPPDAVVTGPGYTPGYDVSTKSASPKVDKPTVAATPAVAPVAATPPPPPAPVASTPAPVQAQVDPNDPFGGMDMMAWMESLAKRQGASSDELTTAANIDVPLPPADTIIDEPGYTPGYDISTKPAAQSTAARLPPPPVPVPVAAVVPEPVVQPAEPPSATPVSDPFAVADQMADPMAWLETLAKRQGAKTEELMTSADMNIPVIPLNTVIDEPGYSDYSPFGGPAPVSEAMDTPSMSSTEAAALLGLSDKAAEPNPLSMMDPLAWLESLAAPQASGSTDFSSFISPSTETSEAMEAASALSWLEQLAREAQGFPYDQASETPSGSIITPSALDNPPQTDISEAWVDTTPASADELGGLSDDMAQLQQWLAAQANSLAGVRDMAEDPAVSDGFDDHQVDLTAESSAEAAPGEIPDWLREHMPGVSTAAPTPANAAPLREIFDEPAIPDDLPAWLLENVAGSAANDPFGFTASSPDEADLVDAFSPEAQSNAASEYDFSEVDQPTQVDQISSDDLNDPWVEAFEYEESRRQAGDENELPDWYTEALARSGETSVPVLAESTSEPQPETQSDVLTPGDYPTWLTGLMSDDAATEDNPERISETLLQDDFDLSEVDDEQPIMAGGLPSWLIESMPDSSGLDLGTMSLDSDPFGTSVDDIGMADLPDWLRATQPEPAPAPPPIAAAVTPSPVLPPTPPPISVPPTPPITSPKVTAPDVREFWGAAQSIAQSMPSLPKADTPVVPPLPTVPLPPSAPKPLAPDHGQQLQRARELVSKGQYRESLTHYQSLVDSEAALDHVIGDMQNIVQAQPTDPSARRLLGDAHLRKGNLQDALDTYRKALDQL